MRIFERNSKINFMDEKNVLVGFDYSQSCCENYGYFFSDKQPKHGDDTTTLVPEDSASLAQMNFVTDYFKEIPEGEYTDGGGAATFKLNDGGRDLFLTIYNQHNGYYGHGFDMTVDGDMIRQGGL